MKELPVHKYAFISVETVSCPLDKIKTYQQQ